MSLTLKPVKCRSLSIRGGKPDTCEFSLGDNMLKTLKDAPQKFLGCMIHFNGKSKERYNMIKSRVSDIITNIDSSSVRDEFRFRIYMQYAVPSMRYLLTVHELSDTQLNELDHLHTNTIKKWLHIGKHGSTPAILYSPDGLNLPRLSDIYLESHSLAYARCMTKADRRVTHALESKLNRESKWSRKMRKTGSNKWENVYSKALDNVNDTRWAKLKSGVKDVIYDDRAGFWRNYIEPPCPARSTTQIDRTK